MSADAPLPPAEDATALEIARAFEAGERTSEQLVARCLARIAAYEDSGPKLRALLAVNSLALETARALDAERAQKGSRSPLHGIPIVVKDVIDTADLPTTAGSVFLEGWTPPNDASVVARLRAAGAVVLAKANTSEFALSSHSSLGGRPRNPHDLTRTASSSSSGSGVAVAAAYAPIALGTDTGGSIRGPASACGVVGLKTTHGLVSCDGVIPLARSFDTVGPMARSVGDVAATLEIIADANRQPAQGYVAQLDEAALNGARLGLARGFMGQDREVDWVVESAVSLMRAQGAIVTDVRFPQWLLDSKQEFYLTIRHSEFAAQIGEYLATTSPGYPKSLADLIERAGRFRATRGDGPQPNPSRWGMFLQEAASPPLDDYRCRTILEFGFPMVRAAVQGMLDADGLDAIIFPPLPQRPGLVTNPDGVFHGPMAPTNIANLTGFPELVTPAGFTSDGLPVGLSFLGAANSEARLLAIGFGFEQAADARRLPVHTPPLMRKVEP